MRFFGIVLALAGCQKIFSIKELPDAATVDGPMVCPTGIGHDEDGDCVPDTMDNCPGIANTGQVDSDGDTIGDDCDPNPGQKGNQLLVFVPFETITEETMWTPLGGAWAIEGDDYVNTDAATGGEDWTTRSPILYGAGAELELRVTVGAFTPGADLKVGGGFYSPAATGTPSEWSCSVHVPCTGIPTVDAFDNGVAASRPLSPSTLFAQGATYTIRMTVDASHVACDIRGDAGDVAAATAMKPNPAIGGYLGLYTQATAARFHDAAVYSAM